MTRREMIFAAFPLHAQRIFELAVWPPWFAASAPVPANVDPATLLRQAFFWANTEEGDSYWRSLYEGARA